MGRHFILLIIIFCFVSAVGMAFDRSVPEYDWPTFPDIPEEEFEKAATTNLGALKSAIWHAEQYRLLRDHVQDDLYPYAVEMTEIAEDLAEENDELKAQRTRLIVGMSVAGGIALVSLGFALWGNNASN